MSHLLEMDGALANDCIRYIFTQLNSESFMGKINQFEYQSLAMSAVRGLDQIIYLKHYSRDIVAKRAFAAAARNLILLLFTRPLEGNDRDLMIKEFESRRPVNIHK